MLRYANSPGQGRETCMPLTASGPQCNYTGCSTDTYATDLSFIHFQNKCISWKNTEQSNIVVSTAKLFMAHVNVIFYLSFMHEVFPCTLRSSQTDVSLLSFCQLISSHYLSNKRSSNFVTDHGWYAFHVTFKDGLKCSHFQNSCS